MKVAIVGSRNFIDLYQVVEYVDSLPRDVVVISGGAKGVDRQAVYTAEVNGNPTEVYKAEWEKHGKRAGVLRNKLIVDAADRVVAFWDGKSRGTAHTIQMALDAGKPVEVRHPRLRPFTPARCYLDDELREALAKVLNRG